ncbi:MAG: OPT/YSL family transporter [Planctomycetota bacterium]
MSDATRRTEPYPELTWPAVLVGWAIGAVIAISIAYAALILGFSIEGSELAAILGWGVLRGVMRRTSILENNINQTIASAVNGASAGIMFTVPALFILAQRDGMESVADFTPDRILLLILSSITGCIIGLAFVIPLRKQMIDFDRLAYPGGIAVATILKSPGAGIRKAMLLLGGALVSGLIHIYVLGFLGTEDWHFGDQFGLPPMLNLVLYLSVMTIGVGFLSGKGGFWFGAGGFICYFLLSPILSGIGSDEVKPYVLGPDSIVAGQELHEGTVVGPSGQIVIEVSANDAEQPDATTEMTLSLSEDQAGAYTDTEAGTAVTVNGTSGNFVSVESGFNVENEAGEQQFISRGEYGPGGMRGLLYRPTGIGMLIGAALGGIFAAFPLILSALASMNNKLLRASNHASLPQCAS